MSNRLEHLLDFWYHKKDACQWILATIVETKGSAYRKAGARMLINSLGKSFGLLSGGCLEADLIREAQKCWLSQKCKIVVYDMQDDTDISWQLGIGCGGMVKVLLQPIDASNNYLDLILLRENLINRVECYYQQSLSEPITNTNKGLNQPVISTFNANQVISKDQMTHNNLTVKPQIDLQDKTKTFTSKVTPRPSIAILGGGTDALPLVNIAHSLGWHISLFDSRVNYARPAYFKNADKIIKQDYPSLSECQYINNADAIIIMNHNLTLDAQALLLSEQTNALYVGILGPEHRTERVFSEAGITRKQFNKTLFNPIGLDLGGELPESIALSILSQVHATIEKTSALPLTNQARLRVIS
ncbi:MAG: XdhC family protein [Alteromonadaceae bacterium]|nr:XdhC family protein [Alteromonadaceae bacterium]